MHFDYVSFIRVSVCNLCHFHPSCARLRVCVDPLLVKQLSYTMYTFESRLPIIIFIKGVTEIGSKSWKKLKQDALNKGVTENCLFLWKANQFKEKKAETKSSF